MTAQECYEMTHDATGAKYEWIVATEIRKRGHKPDLAIWARGYGTFRLRDFIRYLKSGTRPLDEFILIQPVAGASCRLSEYKI